MLNAGATIGAVRETDTHGHYLVRSELHTFLSDVIKRELKRKPEETEKGLDLDRLEKRIREALMPHVLETVRRRAAPSASDRREARLHLGDLPRRGRPEHLRPVRNLLTAGSGLRVVQRDQARPRPLLPARRPLPDAGPHPCPRAGDVRAAERAPGYRGGAGSARLHRRQPRRAPPTAASTAVRPTAQRPPLRTTRRCATGVEETLMQDALGSTSAPLREVADPAIASQATCALGDALKHHCRMQRQAAQPSDAEAGRESRTTARWMQAAER